MITVCFVAMDADHVATGATCTAEKAGRFLTLASLGYE
jgi:hypothetical protein